MGLALASYDKFKSLFFRGYPVQFFPPRLDHEQSPGPFSSARALVEEASSETRILSLLALYYQELAEVVEGTQFNPLSLAELSFYAPQSLLHESFLYEKSRTIGQSKRIARQEYVWLESKFSSLSAFISSLSPCNLSRVLVVGVACWLAFWLRWSSFYSPNFQSNSNVQNIPNSRVRDRKSSDFLANDERPTHFPTRRHKKSFSADYTFSNFDECSTSYGRENDFSYSRPSPRSFFGNGKFAIPEFSVFNSRFSSRPQEEDSGKGQYDFESIDISNSLSIAEDSHLQNPQSQGNGNEKFGGAKAVQSPDSLATIGQVCSSSKNADSESKPTLGRRWFKGLEGVWAKSPLHFVEKLQLPSLNLTQKLKFQGFPFRREGLPNSSECTEAEKSTAKLNGRNAGFSQVTPFASAKDMPKSISDTWQGWWVKRKNSVKDDTAVDAMGWGHPIDSNFHVSKLQDWKLRWSEVKEEDLHKMNPCNGFCEQYLVDLFDGDESLLVKPSHAESTCQLGLAAAMLPHHPTVGSMMLLRLLSRMGSAAFQEGSSEINESSIGTEPCRRFVLACLLNVLTSCNAFAKASMDLDDEGIHEISETPSTLLELAQVAAGDAMSCGVLEGRLLPTCHEADSIYPLTGPGVMAILLTSHMQKLPNLWPHDLIQLAQEIEGWGCNEAGFRVRIRALQSLFSEPANFKRVVQLALRETGIAPVSTRLAKLQESMEIALSRSKASGFRKLYVSYFSDAIIEPLLEDEEHPWGYHLAQIYLAVVNESGPADAFQVAQIEHNKFACAKAICRKYIGDLEGEEGEERLQSWVFGMSDPESEVGWVAWKEIGRMMQYEGIFPKALLHMWSMAIFKSYEAVSDEGTGVDKVFLELFDWGLEGILCTFSHEIMDIEGFVSALHLPDNVRTNVLLKIAARMSCTIFWQWQKRKESAQFIAKILKFLHDSNSMNKEQFNIAIQIATRIWGWTMPDAQALHSRCENQEEAEEIIRNAIVSTWNSIATWQIDGPITCVGESWPM